MGRWPTLWGGHRVRCCGQTSYGDNGGVRGYRPLPREVTTRALWGQLGGLVTSAGGSGKPVGVELGVALIVEQENLDRGTVLSTIKEIMNKDYFAEKATEVQKEVSVLNGLETAIETTLMAAEGGKACVSA